ncbi:MAG: AI-2E family transporter, partial [Hyphomicrobiales bacterium]|nr:AI-2E family transporter [Hyphomicrobiales bacterium]
MDQAHGPVTQTTPAPTRVAIVESGPRLADAAPWALAIVAVALFLYLFSGVLMPFAAGIALGYLLDPVAEKLERLGLNRLGAALFILAVSIILIVLALVLIGPVLGHQLSGFVENLPRIVLRLQALVSDWSAKLLDTSWGSDLATRLGLGSGNPGDIQKALADYAGEAAKWLGGFARSLISGGAALVGILSLIVVTPVVAFYILVDWNRMIASMKSLVPPRYLPEVSA